MVSEGCGIKYFVSILKSKAVYFLIKRTQRVKEPVNEPISHSHQLEMKFSRDCRFSLATGVAARNAVVTDSRFSSPKD